MTKEHPPIDRLRQDIKELVLKAIKKARPGRPGIVLLEKDMWEYVE